MPSYDFRLLFLSAIALILGNGVVSGDFSASGARTNVGMAEDEVVVLESINGTRDFRINNKKDAYDKPWFDGRDFRFIHCVRPAKCERLQNSTCFGSKLPYTMTSLALTDSNSQEESREKLYNYEALRNIPKCWSVIQPFLCAVFTPKCEKIKNHDMVHLPSMEMCRITMEPCRILYNTSFFPEFLKCSEPIFPSRCYNDVREMKFNTMTQCLPPLVQADSSQNYYKDIEHCGVQCKDPLYTDEEHDTVHAFIGFFAFLCFFCNSFVVATFLIHDWKRSKYPAWIVFYPNMCFLVNWFGWFMQFVSENRENIVCRRDGTLRHSEPSAGENLWCVIPFILIYYFLMAAMVWITIFTYAWYLQTTGSARDRIDKLKSYFHLMAWSLPLVLTITIMAMSEVDGNSMTGICFVGYRNAMTRFSFILLPVGVMSLVSFFFTIRGILQLLGMRSTASTGGESKKIHAIILNMGIRMMFLLLCIVGFFVFQLYEFRNTASWAEHLHELIICKIKATYSSDLQTACKLKNRPSVAVLQLRLLCLFGACFVVSSWCWASGSTYKTWNRFIRRRILRQPIRDEEIRQKPKHKMIADLYAKRHDTNTNIEVSLQKSHTDPVNVNYSMGYPVDSELSSVWAKFLPLLTSRRNAVAPNSCESSVSEYPSVGASYSIRHFSVESRRNSADSQMSMKLSVSEIKTKKKEKSRSQRNKFKKANDRIVKSGRIERRRAATERDILNFQKSNQQMRSNDDSRQYELSRNLPVQPANILAAIDYNESTGVIPLSFLNMLSERSGNIVNNKNQQPWRPYENATTTLVGEDESSLSSSIDQDIGNVMHSSYSAQSMGGNGKTHSRNSKSSCDVGIQANAREIAAHARSYDGEMALAILPEKKHSGHSDDDDEFTEVHQLIQTNKPKATVQQRNDANDIGYQARLEQLLLPNRTH